MPLTPIPYDPQHADLFRPLNNSRWEKVIYWKAPDLVKHTGEPYLQAGWVQPRDSSDTAAIGYMRTGWVPLDQFGSTGPDSKNRWHNILSHPEGRALFPLTQILAYHWHRMTNLRHDWPTLPPEYQQDAQLARLFPQLREPGLVIQEFGCPNCHNRVFLSPQGLFMHMSVHHSMKPEDVFAWGRQMGIDFGDRLRDRAVVQVTFADVPLAAPELQPVGPVIQTAGSVPVPSATAVGAGEVRAGRGRQTRRARVRGQLVTLPSVTIGMCAWRDICSGTVASLWSVAQSYPNVSLEIQQGDALITRARSTLATRFLRDMSADVLMTVDSDILWDPEPFMQVATQAHDLQAIVVGAYPTRAWGDGQVSSMLGDREIQFGEDPTPEKILYGASGFMAIPRLALERMRDQLELPLLHPKADRRMQFYPFYEAPIGEAPDGQPIGLSEDFDLCRKAAQVGIDTYVNPAVRLGHIGQQVFRLEHLIWRQPPIVPLTLSNQGIRFAQIPPALTPLVKGGVEAKTSRQQRRYEERQREKAAV